MADRFIRVEREVKVVLFVPHDDEHYPGMTLAQAIARETDRKRQEKLHFLTTDAKNGKGVFRDKVTSVTEEEKDREYGRTPRSTDHAGADRTGSLDDG